MMSIKQLTSYSDALIVSVATAAVLVGSVVFVYLISTMAEVKYTTLYLFVFLLLFLSQSCVRYKGLANDFKY